MVRTEERMADELAAVQEACFPTLSASERMRAEHYRRTLAQLRPALTAASLRPLISWSSRGDA